MGSGQLGVVRKGHRGEGDHHQHGLHLAGLDAMKLMLIGPPVGAGQLVALCKGHYGEGNHHHRGLRHRSALLLRAGHSWPLVAQAITCLSAETVV